jgi:hypothetical protein
MRGRHLPGHCFNCHNARRCTGWNRARPSEVAHHRHSTDTRITGYSAVTDAWAAQAISLNERNIDAASVRAPFRIGIARERLATVALRPTRGRQRSEAMSIIYVPSNVALQREIVAQRARNGLVIGMGECIGIEMPAQRFDHLTSRPTVYKFSRLFLQIRK